MWIDGPNYFLYQVNQVISQNKSVRDVVFPIIWRSVRYARPEAVLQTMLANQFPKICVAVVQIILRIRGAPFKDEHWGDCSHRRREAA